MVLYGGHQWTLHIRIQQDDGWDLWIYHSVLNMMEITYTCHGALVCICRHTRTCIFACMFSETRKHSRNQATSSQSHLDIFFLLSSLLQVISSSHCPCQNPPGPAQLFGLDQEHDWLCPLDDGSRAIFESFHVRHTKWHKQLLYSGL